jgi:hypothetical protein
MRIPAEHRRHSRPLLRAGPPRLSVRHGREAAGPTDRGAMAASSPRPEPGRPAPNVAVGSRAGCRRRNCGGLLLACAATERRPLMRLKRKPMVSALSVHGLNDSGRRSRPETGGIAGPAFATAVTPVCRDKTAGYRTISHRPECETTLRSR